MSVLGNIAKLATTLYNILQVLLVLLIAYFVIRIGSYVVGIFSTDVTLEEFSSSRLLSTEVNDAIVTGLSGLDMLWIKTDNQKEFTLSNILREGRRSTSAEVDDKHIRDYFVREIVKPGVKFYCLQSFDISIGYESVSGLRDALNKQRDLDDAAVVFPEPEILSFFPNTARVNAFDDLRECMEKNAAGARVNLEAEAWSILEQDQLAQTYRRHGQWVAATFLDAGNAQCRPAEEGSEEETPTTGSNTDTTVGESDNPVIASRCWAPLLKQRWAARSVVESGSETDPNALTAPDPDMLFDQGLALGAVYVTISTLFTMNAAVDPWYWFKSEGIYLQRDITTINYGSNVSVEELKDFTRRLFGKLYVEIGHAEELSRDRATSFVIMTGKEKTWEEGFKKNKIKQNPAEYINATINQSAAEVEQRVRKRALLSAEDIIQKRISAQFNGEVAVKFVGRETL